MRNFFFLLILLLSQQLTFGQTGTISGSIFTSKDLNETENLLPASFVKVRLKRTPMGAIADNSGKFIIKDIPFGKYTLQISDMQYADYEIEIELSKILPKHTKKIVLKPNPQLIDQVVVTATRTNKRKTNSPIIVDVINSKTLDGVQACNLSEGLKFQPGLRVETDCQTCNYTQLRMNGLAGGYSQILINGRPVFSPLTGLYGLEQIPVNMIERIEVVRGGGSALYGSSAIGGTVNVITKVPKKSTFNISNNYQNINGSASDNIISGNGTILSENKNAGASFFVNNRNREMYDDNLDNFSELPELKNTSFGANLFVLPSKNQKIEISLSSINEFRYGGEIVQGAPHLALQSEERTHHVLVGSADYQINFNNNNTSLIAYSAAQQTTRLHYTGVFPDDSIEIITHLSAPPYGNSLVTTIQGGTQLNHRINNFIKGSNIITIGSEYIEDNVRDDIPAYNYKVNQLTANLGVFLQSDWEITPNLSLLLGARADKHNMLRNAIISPRAAFLLKLKKSTQFRLAWGTGFRAPQAFDTDLHIAFAGGGVSRVFLSDELKEERSNSLSASVNMDNSKKNYIIGFTLEGFYTELKNAFYMQPLGEDAYGEVFEKRNGDGAKVMGTSLQIRGNYNKKIELDAGMTLQSSLYDSPIFYSDELPSTSEFLKTPSIYGYGTLFYTPKKPFTTTLSAVYTGEMKVLHMAGAEGVPNDEFIRSQNFFELSIKSGYKFIFKEIACGLELFVGIKNIFNSYQPYFDLGKNRDSNFVYGPSLPRTFFIGMKLFSL